MGTDYTEMKKSLEDKIRKPDTFWHYQFNQNKEPVNRDVELRVIRKEVIEIMNIADGMNHGNSESVEDYIRSLMMLVKRTEHLLGEFDLGTLDRIKSEM